MPLAAESYLALAIISTTCAAEALVVFLTTTLFSPSVFKATASYRCIK
jgi:hypothetical protein